ncbi:hypothetical protein SETIT_5G116000v2 [Setaria italica]|uniref:Uncharacterized protein n=1 Tax=Setaria italica TaxID=4555 RepID=A0A368R3N6_SETIT|nr:hypothetical protein SETIT_5G116000v2 [Setaria italica]
MSGQAGSSGGAGAGPPPATAFKSLSTDGKRRSTRFKDEDEYVEVMLDIRGDGYAVAVRSVKGVPGGGGGGGARTRSGPWIQERSRRWAGAKAMRASGWGTATRTRVEEGRAVELAEAAAEGRGRGHRVAPLAAGECGADERREGGEAEEDLEQEVLAEGVDGGGVVRLLWRFRRWLGWIAGDARRAEGGKKKDARSGRQSSARRDSYK